MENKKKGVPKGTLRKDSKTFQLYNRIIEGEERTVKEWAKILNITENNLRTKLTSMRKTGYPIFPIGTVKGKGQASSQGVLKLITESLDDCVETSFRYRDQHQMPLLKNLFRLYEQQIVAHPELADTIESDLNQLQIAVISRKEEFKQLSK